MPPSESSSETLQLQNSSTAEMHASDMPEKNTEEDSEIAGTANVVAQLASELLLRESESSMTALSDSTASSSESGSATASSSESGIPLLIDITEELRIGYCREIDSDAHPQKPYYMIPGERLVRCNKCLKFMEDIPFESISSAARPASCTSVESDCVDASR